MALQRASAHSDDDDVVIAADDQRSEDEQSSKDNINIKDGNTLNAKGKSTSYNPDFVKSGSFSSILTDIEITNSQRSQASLNSGRDTKKSKSANEENINRSNKNYSKLKGLKRPKSRRKNISSTDPSLTIENHIEQQRQRSRFTVHTPNKDYSSISTGGNGLNYGEFNSSTNSTKIRSKQKRKTRKHQPSERITTSIDMDSDVDVDIDSLPSYFSEIDEFDTVQ